MNFDPTVYAVSQRATSVRAEIALGNDSVSLVYAVRDLVRNAVNLRHDTLRHFSEEVSKGEWIATT